MPIITEITESAKRGRPPGETTPEALMRQEFIAHIKLYRKTREMIESKITTGQIGVDDLVKYMDLLRKGIVDLGKPILPNARPEAVKATDDEGDAASILEKLIAGPGR